jgi:cellulose synthase/poly-beta-1,6-N-acetylglucosamine synthase-like glycosyltransferase
VGDPRVWTVVHARNQGKGAAIRTPAHDAGGDFMVILDADLEYDPQDIITLLEPVLGGRATVVSRAVRRAD